jgi:transmembrane sensor
MTRSMESPVPNEDQAMAQAAAWVARLGGDVDGEDGVEFDAWLEAAPGNRAAFNRAVLLVQEFDARAGDVLAELDAFERQTPARPPAARRVHGTRGGRRSAPMRWFAPIGGVAVAAGLALAVMPSLMAPAKVTAYTTGKGQHHHVTLADGSTIDLDAETKLRVSMSRTERRVILSDGQAIFDVAHDEKRPFVVEAGQRLVRDVGTQFDVRQRPDQLTVTVARGRVEVESSATAAPGKGVLLGPGQRLTLDNAGVGRLSVVDPQETFSWRAGRLVYRAQPLADVVADLNRQFVEQTEIADPELGKLPITGVIVLDNPRAVVARLSLMLPVKAVPSDKGLMLLRK